MAVPSLATFRVNFPEFTNATDALLQAAIDRASTLCDATTYGDLHTQAVLFTAADDLAMSPFSREMRLKDGTSVYQKRVKQLQRIAAIGIRAV